jgi:hypothetical protein
MDPRLTCRSIAAVADWNVVVTPLHRSRGIRTLILRSTNVGFTSVAPQNSRDIREARIAGAVSAFTDPSRTSLKLTSKKG